MANNERMPVEKYWLHWLEKFYFVIMKLILVNYLKYTKGWSWHGTILFILKRISRGF
jgi:hypothetical protein